MNIKTKTKLVVPLTFWTWFTFSTTITYNDSINLINIIFIFIILTNLVDQEIQLDQDHLKYRGYMYNMSLIINDFFTRSSIISSSSFDTITSGWKKKDDNQFNYISIIQNLRWPGLPGKPSKPRSPFGPCGPGNPFKNDLNKIFIQTNNTYSRSRKAWLARWTFKKKHILSFS
jgi:hypothetical protein